MTDQGSGPATRYPPIESHGVIGDLQSVALVGMDGCIDFLCLPAFDSPSIFASLLDHERGGHFGLQPALDDANHKQLYLPDTNVLLTRFLSSEGVAEISDFMPIHPEVHPSRVVRRVKTVRGEIRFRMRCAPRFEYARAEHTLERVDGGVLFRGGDGLVLRLSTPVPLDLAEGDAVAEFVLQEGESVPFVLEQVLEGQPVAGADPHYISESFKETVNFWRDWIGTSTYQGRWRDEVHRSALALKLLHSRQTGAVVAAPTFGLPEDIGGVRNWDYRYTWIRDASFTLYALIRLGMTGETRDFIRWPRATCRSSTGSMAGRGFPSTRWSTWRGTGARARSASATPRTTSSSSTSTASCWTRSTCTTSTGSAPVTISGAGCRSSSTGCATTGISRTRECGRCAASGGTSCTPA